MKAAIYPGSFDPLTLGHMDVIIRSANIFDELIVAVLDNKAKSPLFSVEERVKMIREATKDLPNVKVESFSGLLIDYAKSKDIHVSVRGLRACLLATRTTHSSTSRSSSAMPRSSRMKRYCS